MANLLDNGGANLLFRQGGIDERVGVLTTRSNAGAG
jgi:hypothetical protein